MVYKIRENQMIAMLMTVVKVTTLNGLHNKTISEKSGRIWEIQFTWTEKYGLQNQRNDDDDFCQSWAQTRASGDITRRLTVGQQAAAEPSSKILSQQQQ